MEDDAPPGVPEWVVTYGDMMSLLLTFFIMLVSLSEVVADQKYRAIMEALQQYTGYNTSHLAPPGKNFPLNSLLTKLEMLGSYTNDDNGKGGVKTESVEGTDVRILRTREGTPRMVGRPIFFKPGTTDFADNAESEIKTIAKTLAGKPNKIEIRGHTRPETDASAKIEICYQRSRKVWLLLKQEGIVLDRMRISAASDNEPVKGSGDRLLEQDDRAEVYILDAYIDAYIGPHDPAN